ncbi:MAG TPA: hypothetical protein VN829_03490 [Dongiaceae bacterium]|nr:hypothetical protein [Dongiaceae bacterium]
MRQAHTAGAPAFALDNVSDFDAHMCAGMPVQLAEVEQKTF